MDDGSTDKSLYEAQILVGKRENFTIITYKQNHGRGFAIRQGFANARGDMVVAIESDLSWGEDIVERMVNKLEEEDLDVVVASPHCKGGRLENISLMRTFYTKVGNKILNFLMPVKLTMYTGMTRAYRSEVLRCLDLESDDKELHLEIISKIASLGYRIEEIPANLTWIPSRRKRKEGFKARRYILSHLLFGIGESPLLILVIASLVFLIIGIGMGVYLLILSLSGTPVSGRPSIQFSMLSMLVGFILLLFGFIAQQNKRLERQLHRLQREIKKRTANEGETGNRDV